MHDKTKPNPLIELLATLIIPSLILMKFSGEDDLGALNALLLALALPLFWGVRDFIARRKLNFFAALGLVSILLTGGIGLLQLDTQWLAIKESAIPDLIGVTVFTSAHTRYPLVQMLLYTPTLMNVGLIQESLDARGNRAAFEISLKNATRILGGSFFFSSAITAVPQTLF
jgi:hypothetical protein